MSKAVDIQGKRFGKLVVIERRGSTRTARNKVQSMWACRCDCGNERLASAQALMWSGIRSCGCGQYAKTALGHCTRRFRSLTYRSWESMIARCFQESNPAHEHYKKRGITVCERWRTFANFLEDMGERPSRDLTLERVDNDAGYQPGNCRWATRLEQGNNTSAVKLYEYRGGRYSISALARLTGVSQEMLRWRLVSARGWTVEGAVHTPRARREDSHKMFRV